MYKVPFPSRNVPAVKQRSILISQAIGEVTAGANNDNLLLGESSSKQNTSSAVTMLQFKPILFFFCSVMRFLPGGRGLSLQKTKEPCLTQSHSVITSATESSRKWGVALRTWTLFKFSLRSLNSRKCLQPGKLVTIIQRNLALMKTRATTKAFVSLTLPSSSLRIHCVNHVSLYQERQFSSYVTVPLKSYQRGGGLLWLYTLLTPSLVTALRVSLTHRELYLGWVS